MVNNWQQSITYHKQQFIAYYIEGRGKVYEIFYNGTHMCKRDKCCLQCRWEKSMAQESRTGQLSVEERSLEMFDVAIFFIGSIVLIKIWKDFERSFSENRHAC
jgi:hypothetical protein